MSIVIVPSKRKQFLISTPVKPVITTIKWYRHGKIIKERPASGFALQTQPPPSKICMQYVPHGKTIDESAVMELTGKRNVPYPSRDICIDNLCGMLLDMVDPRCVQGALQNVASVFGPTKEIYHLEGNIMTVRGKGVFKGCKGQLSIDRISHSLSLDSSRSLVHMAILSCAIGKMVQATRDGFLVQALQSCVGSKIAFVTRMDEDNCVRFNIVKFEGVFDIESGIVPVSNDWSVTCKGAVMCRFVWKNLRWSYAVEQSVLSFSRNVVDILRHCC